MNLDKYNQYIKGEMSEEELDDFTRELLKKHYEKDALKNHWKKLLEEKKEQSSLESNTKINEKSKEPQSKVRQLSPKTETVSRKSNKNSKTRLRALVTTFAIAASLIFAVLYFIPNQSTNTLSALDKIVYEHQAVSITSRGNSEDGEIADQRRKASEFYEQKNYSKAIPLLKNIMEAKQQTNDDLFLLGLSYHYNKEPQKAISTFEQLLQKDNLERKDAITWHLALALVSSGNCEKANPYLNEVSNWTGNKGKLKLAEKAKQVLNTIQTEGCIK